ncbi:MAG: hypothetical protein NVSMB39_4710 [Candidatus Saccharimonadales bacterium]
MSQGSTTRRAIHLIVDDASEYLRTRNAHWWYDTAMVHGELLAINMEANFFRANVLAALRRESQRLGRQLSLATHENLEEFACTKWDRKVSVVAFGSFVEHPDLGKQVAILYGGARTTMELVGADKCLSKSVQVLCVAE